MCVCVCVCVCVVGMRNKDGRYTLMFEEWVTEEPFIISPRISFEVRHRADIDLARHSLHSCNVEQLQVCMRVRLWSMVW